MKALLSLPSKECSALWVFSIEHWDSDLLQCIVGVDECSRYSLLDVNGGNDVTCDVKCCSFLLLSQALVPQRWCLLFTV